MTPIRNPGTPATRGGKASGQRPASDCGLPPSDCGLLSPRPSAAAFTLMEVMLALGVSAIVLAGIGSVFYSAVRLRERTAALVDASAPLHQALALLRRDLQGALPPEGTLAVEFRAGATGSSGMVQNYALQFCTTTGIIKDSAPWGDVQEVYYELREPAERTNTGGRDLVRGATRNLLATLDPASEEQALLGNVESLEFACYDGLNWRDAWDSSLGDTNLPVAIRVRILMVSEANADNRNRQPIELVVPLMVQSRTNQVQTTGGQW